MDSQNVEENPACSIEESSICPESDYHWFGELTLCDESLF